MVVTSVAAALDDVLLIRSLYFCLYAVGAHFTYSRVPYNEALRSPGGMSVTETPDFSQNRYDRIVYFAYGFLLVLPVRELLSSVRKSSWVLELLPTPRHRDVIVAFA